MKTLIYIYLCAIMATGIQSRTPDYYDLNLNNFRQEPAFLERINLDDPDAKRLNAAIFFVTNEQRVAKKLPELEYHPLLEEAATIHSREMADRGFFDHINPKSRKFRNPDDRARYAGISNPHLAENIIESFGLEYEANTKVYPGERGVFRYKPDADPIPPHTYLSLAEVMVNKWMNSPPHRKNILLEKAEQLGCGSAFYVNEDFYGMPTVLSTQNFQLHEKVRVME